MPPTGRIFLSSSSNSGSPSSTCASQGSVCDLASLPDATEIDRILVRATAAALDASVNIPDSQLQQDVNANNEVCGIHESLNIPTEQAQKKSTSLGHRFRSLFGFAPKVAKAPATPRDVTNDEMGQPPHQQQQQRKKRSSRSSQHRELQQLRQQLFLQHQQEQLNAGVNGMEAIQQESKISSNQSKQKGICNTGAGGCEVTPQPELINLSNTPTPNNNSKGSRSQKKLKKQRNKKKTNKQQQNQQQLPERIQVNMLEQQPLQQQKLELTSAELPTQLEQRQPLNNVANTDGAGGNSDEPVSDASPPLKMHVFRGGPTTVEHQRLRDNIFRECRIIPVSTLYKKVAMVAGRERLLLTAPSNPRSLGSPLLYDIAYENHRHHSDCNRDFVRVGLKKICSNYCRPSQFRYVY